MKIGMDITRTGRSIYGKMIRHYLPETQTKAACGIRFDNHRNEDLLIARNEKFATCHKCQNALNNKKI